MLRDDRAGEFVVNHIQIRPARDSDGDGIAALMQEAFAEYDGCLFDRAAEFPELDAIASYYKARGGVIWVAEMDGRVVGSMATAPTRDADAPAGTWEVFKVYVAQAARRRGLARTLYAHVLERVQAEGAPELRLWTDTRFLDAHRFYESCGFVLSGEPRELHDISLTLEFPYRLRLVPAASQPDPAGALAHTES